jgi:surface polysaccharide O-acyltransferase-like enzyme
MGKSGREGSAVVTEKTAASVRSAPVDAAKSIAIFGVLLIHSFAVGGFTGRVGSFNWCAGLFWGTILRCAVPVFFLCSGALLLRPEKDVSAGRVWKHYIPHILLALLFWAAAYEGWGVLLTWHRTGVLEAAALGRAAANVLLFRHKSHLYYLHIILLVYALLPVSRVFAARASRREYRYLLAAWALLGIVLPAVQGVPPFSALRGIPRQYPLNLTYASLGYTLAGYYLSRYGAEHRPRTWALVFLAGFALSYGGTLALSLRAGKLYEPLLYGSAPGVCAQALGVWGWCVSALRDAPSRRWTQTISRASFCIFLSHLFFLDFFQSRGFTAASFPAAASVPTVAAALFVCGFAVWLVLRKVPWVNRWLI